MPALLFFLLYELAMCKCTIAYVLSIVAKFYLSSNIYSHKVILTVYH